MSSSLAQVPPSPNPITSSGLNTQVNLSATPPAGKVQYDITGGARPGGGLNLFHSFGEFGVPTNNIANFLNETALPTNNILGRVTGGNISNIFGTIQTTGFLNANLFLMNPAGFLFGPNATVNVGGMVAFTSANYLRLGELDGSNAGIFHADSAQASVLTNAPVAAFGFLGSNPGAITVQGSQFSVTDGQSISLVGGNVTIQSGTLEHGTSQLARLSAPNGNIQLASATSPGEFDATILQPIPNVDGATFASSGSVRLAQNSIVDVSATGTVSIRGGQFVLEVANAVVSTSGNSSSGVDNIVLNNGSAITAATTLPGNAGSVTVNAESIVLLGNSSIVTATDGEGNGGLVSLTAPSIELHGNSNIGTSTAGLGNAGDIELHGNQVNLTESFVTARTQAEGHGGNITIRGLTGEGSHATDVRLSDKSQLGSGTIGDGENIQGGAGNILVETARLNLSGGSLFNTTSRGSTGAAGNIMVNATDSLTISGFGTQINSDSMEFSFGDAGHISISAPSVVIENSGRISTSTSLVGNAGTIAVHTNNLQLLSGGHITSSSLPDVEFPEGPPSGAAGTVIIQGLASPAQSVLIDGPGSGLFTDTQGTGAGGNIALNANSVTLTNGATVSASSTGQIETPGDAGSINITAPNGLTMQNSAIKTQAGQGASGGDIKVTTAPSATVLLENSRISASVADGEGGGGNISIDPQFVILQNSQILAQAAQGQGGAITITTNLFLPDANSIVNADSGSGLNGTVTIQSPNAPASGKIQPLGKTPLLPTSLLNQHCASLAGGEFSSFTVAGRDSLPTEPGSWLASPLALTTLSAGMGKAARGEGLEDETALLSLRQIAPAGFLTQAFAVDWSEGCQS
ncbi:MAG: filamentous hemagglutinin N-terminal domain-containing protein [Pyrinomonadaceae bacterium]|nr:filamentous hemagglutinin N-terminal domain-containing protein [Pyrinomonadaceae bacterium]